MHKCWGIGIILLWILGACEPKEPIGPFSSIPHLHTLSLSQDTLQEFVDSLFMYVEYEDAEGDIGFDSPEQKSLSIKDSRLEEADLHHVPPLTGPGVSVHIQGRFQVNLGKLFLLSTDDEEKVVFKVQLRDREGNWSEELESDTLYLQR